MGVVAHSLARCAAEMIAPPLGNVAIADTMVTRFTRSEVGAVPHSHPQVTQLRLGSLFGQKRPPVTVSTPIRPPNHPRRTRGRAG